MSDIPMRILMMLHTPWERNLGGSRVQFELAEELRSRGHEVDKFDSADGCPGIAKYAPVNIDQFARNAREFIKREGSRFDVIDAQQGNLPFVRSEVEFGGLLVARSVGLYAFYDDFQRFEKKRWVTTSLKTRMGNALRAWKSRNAPKPQYLKSLQHADLVLGMNEDETNFARVQLGFGDKCEVAPYGIPAERADALRSASAPPNERLAEKQVVFIGSWAPRKGSKDWAEILRTIRAKVPSTTFLFLGTGATEEKVLSDIGCAPSAGIAIVPHYKSEQLPGLIARGAVCALPTYIEGFGIGILECLAAGIPAVSYDVPGPRDMLNHFSRKMMSPRGEAVSFGNLVAEILQTSGSEYSALCDESLAITRHFNAEKVATETLRHYETYLKLVKSKREVLT